VYIFRASSPFTTWTQIQRLTQENSTDPLLRRFGHSVGLSDNGTLLVVGARNSSDGGTVSEHHLPPLSRVRGSQRPVGPGQFWSPRGGGAACHLASRMWRGMLVQRRVDLMPVADRQSQVFGYVWSVARSAFVSTTSFTDPETPYSDLQTMGFGSAVAVSDNNRRGEASLWGQGSRLRGALTGLGGCTG
jgi:hypothetical protein